MYDDLFLGSHRGIARFWTGTSPVIRLMRPWAVGSGVLISGSQLEYIASNHQGHHTLRLDSFVSLSIWSAASWPVCGRLILQKTVGRNRAYIASERFLLPERNCLFNLWW